MNKGKIKKATFLAFIVLGIQGCSVLPGMTTCGKGVSTFSEGTAGISVNGQSIHYTRIGCGPRTSLVYGGIHGDEPASAVLTEQLIDKLRTLPLEWKTQYQVIAISAVNPDGLKANTRSNARGVDLNRNFPSSNRINNAKFGIKALSEPETMALYKVQKTYPSSRVIAIHQPLACIDYDGPAQQISLVMGHFTQLPQCHLHSRPGSHGSYTGVDHNTPIITFEMRREDDELSSETLWKIYGKAIMAGIMYPALPVDL